MIRTSVILLLFPITSFAQFAYSIDQSIPVEANQRNLALPWAGGLNSAQINTMDLDGDGHDDLVVFDRSADKLLPFRNVGQRYEYAPDFEVLFPPNVSQWMLLRDFNCDGKKDLFTSDPFGIAVFVNVTPPGGTLTWREFNPGFPLLTKGFNGTINLKINDVDIPAIDDVDNDGDLDILSMRFVGVGTVEWHKNMSIENTGRCDSLQLERVTQTYGGLRECLCGLFAYNDAECPPNTGRVQHVGGKTLLTIDMDGDGDRELLYSEESCAPVYMFNNNGTKEAPVFNSFSLFPPTTPAVMPIFPAPFHEDVDFDGKKDLVVSPNVYARLGPGVIVRNSVWFYKNTGTAEQPNFTLLKNDFLQEDMIDVGDYSTPALFDVDNDGDDDLFVGAYANENFRGRVQFYENVGSAANPSFRLLNDDFASLTSIFIYNIKPQIADVNGDGAFDFAFTATSLQDGITRIYFAPGTEQKGLVINFAQLQPTEFRIGQAETARMIDVNRDGRMDLLVGKATGALQYWEANPGSVAFSDVVLKDPAFLGMGSSTSRQNPAVVAADFDGDGFEDLLVADQKGQITFYGDFRSFNPALVQPTPGVVHNSITKDYHNINFGGRLWPAVGNLFNSSKPAIVLGNTLGGLYLLRNDEGQDLPEDPVVGVGPNPLERGEDLQIRSDRNTRVQIFSILGQKMSEQIFVPANQNYKLALKEMAAGMYVARFSFPGRTISIKFVLK